MLTTRMRFSCILWTITLIALACLGCGDGGRAAWKAGKRQLFEAIDQENIAAVKSSIEAGTDLNTEKEYSDPSSLGSPWKTVHHHTPLHRAAFKGNYEIVELLLSSGAPIRADQYYGQTPLYTAVQEGHVDIIKLLLAEGADINAREEGNRMTPLHIAAKTHPDFADKYAPIVEQLIAVGADVNATADLLFIDYDSDILPDGARSFSQQHVTVMNKTPTFVAKLRRNSRISEILEAHGGK